MELKKYLIVVDHAGDFEMMPREQYEKYVKKVLSRGGAPAIGVVAHYNGDERLYVDAEQASPDVATIADYEEVLKDHRRIVREIDVILNGKDAAKQASLIDLVGQIQELKDAPDAKPLIEALEKIRDFEDLAVSRGSIIVQLKQIATESIKNYNA